MIGQLKFRRGVGRGCLDVGEDEGAMTKVGGRRGHFSKNLIPWDQRGEI